MVIGLGCDLVSIERMRHHYTEKLAKKILTSEEISGYNSANDKALYLAKCWAVKEATWKSLSDKKLDMLKDVSYVSPNVHVVGQDDIDFLVSLSDDNGFVMATVVAQKKEVYYE